MHTQARLVEYVFVDVFYKGREVDGFGRLEVAQGPNVINF